MLCPVILRVNSTRSGIYYKKQSTAVFPFRQRPEYLQANTNKIILFNNHCKKSKRTFHTPRTLRTHRTKVRKYVFALILILKHEPACWQRQVKTNYTNLRRLREAIS